VTVRIGTIPPRRLRLPRHCGRGATLLRVESILLVTLADKRKWWGGRLGQPQEENTIASLVLVNSDPVNLKI